MSDRSVESVAPSGDDENGPPVGGQPRRGTSRWQKVVAIVGLVVLLVLGMRMFASGGHGPGQDTTGEQQQEDGGHQPPPWVPDH
jgi:hypothetical protein